MQQLKQHGSVTFSLSSIFRYAKPQSFTATTSPLFTWPKTRSKLAYKAYWNRYSLRSRESTLGFFVCVACPCRVPVRRHLHQWIATPVIHPLSLQSLYPSNHRFDCKVVLTEYILYIYFGFYLVVYVLLFSLICTIFRWFFVRFSYFSDYTTLYIFALG